MRRRDYPNRTEIVFGGDTTVSITQSSVKYLYEDMKYRHATPGCAVEALIEVPQYGVLRGVVESWDLNHPTFLFESGRRGFLSPAEDDGNSSLLFKKGYIDDAPHTSQKRHSIETAKLDIYWTRTPSCPHCDDDLTYGMVEWSPYDSSGYMSGWLCESSIPARVEAGTR